MDINKKVIVITGGAIRVGRAIGLHLAGLGADIAFSYLGPEEDWEKTKADIEAKGVRCLAVQTDVRRVEEIRWLIKTAYETFGRIDGLINNAGVWLKAPAARITEEEWDAEMDINLKGPFFAAQAATDYMKRTGGGVIVNITDLSAFQVWPEYAHHGAAKTGLASITKSLAAEFAPEIRVNAAAFGTILLPPNATPEKEKWSKEKSVLKRIGKLEEAVKLIQFLLENDFATGSIYQLDGGRSLL